MASITSTENQFHRRRPSKFAMLAATAALTVTVAGMAYSKPEWLPSRLAMGTMSPMYVPELQEIEPGHLVSEFDPDYD